MNGQQFEQSWDQLKKGLQQHWGKLTEDDLTQIAGDQGKFNGAIEKRYGERKTEVTKWANRWYAHWTGWYEGYEPAKPAS